MEVRTTLNGVSAAFGKAGALLGSALFPIYADYFGYPATFLACSAVALAGALLTYAFVIDARTAHSAGRCCGVHRKQYLALELGALSKS